jgi:hypothetical protein
MTARCVTAVILAAAAVAAAARGEEPRGRSRAPGPPDLSLNENMIEARRTPCGDLASVPYVFRLVFERLPPAVKVFPTENYYYFRFDCDSREVWGNVRLDAEDRDRGLIDFAYFFGLNRPERPDDLSHTGGYAQLGTAEGVRVTRVALLVYDVSFQGRTVRFQLNDVAQTPLPKERMLPSERFIERVFDESGFQFALLFDDASKGFRFVLDQMDPLPDTLEPAAPDVVVGRISGFAFYVDRTRDRRVLIGVDADNMRRNNYYDGPFDQLADNFLRDDRRQRAMEEAYPYARGRIDRRGVFLGATGERLALTPLHAYASLDELRAFVTRARAATADDEALLTALTYDYKKAVPAAVAPPAAISPRPVPLVGSGSGR